MTRHGLHIEPLDVLFFRDGRPFEAAMRGTSGLPLPQTLAGAVRTALLSRTGFNFQVFSKARRACTKLGQESRDALKEALRAGHAHEWIVKAAFRGPWPAVFLKDRPVPLFSQPLDRIRAKEDAEFVWLRPKVIPGWVDDPDGLLALTRDRETDGKASPKLFSLPALRAYLDNETKFGSTELFEARDIYDFDDRSGIGVNAETLASADGMIYGIRFLAMKPRVANHEKHGDYADAKTGLYAEIDCDFPRDDLKKLLADPIPFGGESRYSRIAVINPVGWPEAKSGTKTKWLLVSPGFIPFSKKSQRPLPDIPGLIAAASAAGIAVSGWDVAKNGPRATRFAIPAGAVYYFEGPGPADGFLGGSEDDKAEGWGFALPGTWED